MKIKNIFKSLAVTVIRTSIIQNYLGQRTQNLATIFMLHRMDFGIPKYNGHSPDFLRAALQNLKDNNYKFVSVTELLQRAKAGAKPIKKAVAFTMDDGYLDQAKIALPIFLEFNCPITVFLITGFIDKKILPWDTVIKYCFYETSEDILRIKIANEDIIYNLSSISDRVSSMRDFRERCKFLNEFELKDAINMLSTNSSVEIFKKPIDFSVPLSWDDARDAETHEEVDFGVHTVNHLILSRLSEQRAINEISKSWDSLSRELKEPVKVFAYPVGRYDDFLLRDMHIVKQHDYLGAVTAEPGYLNQNEIAENEYSRYMIKRFSFPDNTEDLIQFTSGIEFIKHKLRNNYFFSFWSNKRFLLHFLMYKIYSFIGLYKEFKRIEWDKVNRLVFVCKGNICRSPYAEYKSLKLGLDTISVGVDTDGKSNADEMAMKISAIRGVNLSTHVSRKATDIEYTESDLLVCMEPWHAKMIKNNQNIKHVNYQTTVLGLWCTNQIALIRDPYAQSADMFIKCFDLIDDSLSNIYNLMNR